MWISKWYPKYTYTSVWNQIIHHVGLHDTVRKIILQWFGQILQMKYVSQEEGNIIIIFIFTEKILKSWWWWWWWWYRWWCDKVCRPGYHCSSQCSFIRQKIRKLQRLWFGYCTWPQSQFWWYFNEVHAPYNNNTIILWKYVLNIQISNLSSYLNHQIGKLATSPKTTYIIIPNTAWSLQRKSETCTRPSYLYPYNLVRFCQDNYLVMVRQTIRGYVQK